MRVNQPSDNAFCFHEPKTSVTIWKSKDWTTVMLSARNTAGMQNSEVQTVKQAVYPSHRELREKASSGLADDDNDDDYDNDEDEEEKWQDCRPNNSFPELRAKPRSSSTAGNSSRRVIESEQ